MTLSSDDSVNNAIIGALDDQLSDSEQRFLKTKVETSLGTADGNWLDKWGYWFGQRRLNGWSDDEYRQHIIYHVTHGRNTIDSIKEAIANFLNVNKDSIYIYEPYRDMFILNDSLLNSNKCLPSTYYRYAAIDIRISSNIPDEVISIINLFRPAGVLWVLTHDINRFDENAQVFDMESPKELYSPSISYKYFIGLVNKENYVLTASNNEYSAIENPFIYNSNSLLNSDSLLDGTLNTSKQYSIIGQSGFTVIPDSNDTLSVLSYEMEQPDSSEIKRLGLKDGFGHYFSTSLVKDNLISNANGYIKPIKLDGNSGSPNLALGTATSVTTTGTNVNNQLTSGYGFSSVIPKGTLVTATFDITSSTGVGTYTMRFNGNDTGGSWQTISTVSLVNGKKHISVTLTTDSNHLSILPKLDSATGTITLSNFIISNINTEIPYAPAPSEQTVSKSGSLVLPVVNINSNSSYAFSMLSNASDDIANASLNLIVKDSLGNDVSSVISNSTSSGKHVLNIGLSTSASFSSNGYAVLQYSGIDVSKSLYVSLLCIKVATDNLISNANSWSPNSNDKQLANEINVELDIKSFINDNISTLSSSTTSSDINAMFQEKRFQITSKLNDITTPSVTVNPYVFNYNANVFMSLDSFTADNSGYKDYFIDFNDVTPFINSNGIMSFKLVPENYKNGLSIDYFGLGIYNTTDEEVLDANKDQTGLGLSIA